MSNKKPDYSHTPFDQIPEEEYAGKITYRPEGDYMLPNLTVPQRAPLGKYGNMRNRFLKEQYPIKYQSWLMDDLLYDMCLEAEQKAWELRDELTTKMANEEGVTNELKKQDQMEWLRRMNSIQNRAEEIVLQEVVYNSLS